MGPQLHTSDLGTVLGIWAHPDDEAFLAAGLTARITDAGGTVAVLTATRGERGTPDPDDWQPDRLGRRRALELRASLAVVGVTDHESLGLVDGTLHEVPDAVGAGRVGAALERVRPDTVITFGPDGLTGHSDHMAVSRWASRACRDGGRPVRLLHATKTTSFAHRWADVNRRANAFAPGLPVGTPPDEVALELHLDQDELDRKVVAFAAHSSQVMPLAGLLNEPELRGWLEVESFRLAPTPRTPHGRPRRELVTAGVAPRWP